MHLRRPVPLPMLVLLAAAAAAFAAGSPAAGAGMDGRTATRLLGDWHGRLDPNGARMRIAVHFTRAAGRVVGTLDSPDQQASGLPIDSVYVRRDTLFFEMRAIGGRYRGVFSRDGGSLEGTWQQGTAQALNLVRGPLPEIARVQEPAKPYPYAVEEVAVRNEAAGVTLAGTLTEPRGAGPFPAAVLIGGTGRGDRDLELQGHRPFLVLADRLARDGVAVLRLDDRGIGRSTGRVGSATLEDLAADVRAALGFLAARPELDRARLGVIGHGEGSLVATMVASGAKDVAFLVLLAGHGVPGDRELVLQGDAVMRVMGEREDMISWNHRLQDLMFAEVAAVPDSAQLHARLLKVIAAALQRLPPQQLARVSQANLEEQAADMSTRWFRSFLAFDPGPALRRVTCPVLAMTGGYDMQVPASDNLPAIESALTAGGNHDVHTIAMPNLNHRFQNAPTGSPAEYGNIEETFAPAALDSLSSWLGARVLKPAPR